VYGVRPELFPARGVVGLPGRLQGLSGMWPEAGSGAADSRIRLGRRSARCDRGDQAGDGEGEDGGDQ